MRLTFETQPMDDAVAIRCKGRICFGPEVDALQAEVNRTTKVAGTDIFQVKRVVLDLAETEFVDSAGLGALVRLHGVLRAAGGGLKLCRMSPFVQQVIEVTSLESLFPAYATEAQAIAAFSSAPRTPSEPIGSSKTVIVCVDPSSDLLAGLKALLSGSGYEVFTTRYVGEASTLVNAMRPKVVICGPGMMAIPTAPAVIEKFQRSGGNLQIMHLPSDFQSTEAGQAGQELVSRVRSLVAS